MAVDKVALLLSKRGEYLEAFEGHPKYQILSISYEHLEKNYYQYLNSLLRVTPMPTKPTNAYVAGGIGNGLGGPALGVAAFVDAKEKEAKYKEDMQKYDDNIYTVDGSKRNVDRLFAQIIEIIELQEETKLNWNKYLREKVIENDKKERLKREEEERLANQRLEELKPGLYILGSILIIMILVLFYTMFLCFFD